MTPKTLFELFGGKKGLRHPDLALLYRHLTEERDSRAVYYRLREVHPKVKDYLREIVGGKRIDRASLEALADLPGVWLLLDSAQRTGIIPPLSSIERLERHLKKITVGLSRPMVLLLRQYCRFHLREYVRQHEWRRPNRASGADVPYLSIVREFLLELEAKGVALEMLTQNVVDQWLLRNRSYKRKHLQRFVAWLIVANIVRRSLRVPGLKRNTALPLAEGVLLALLDRARTDSTLDLTLRVGLLLLILCCRPIGVILALRSRDIRHTSGGRIEIRFSKGVSEILEGPEAKLVLQLAARSKTWLFPSVRRPKHTSSVGFRRGLLFAGIEERPRDLVTAALNTRLKHLETGAVARSVGFQPGSVYELLRRRGRLGPNDRVHLIKSAV